MTIRVSTGFRGRRGRFAAVLCAVGVIVLTMPAAARAACSVTSGDFDANGSIDMRFIGDAYRQNLLLDLGNGSVQVKLDCNGDGDYADPGDFDFNITTTGGLETFDIQLRGKDAITILQSASVPGDRKNLLLTLGPGGNVVEIDNFFFAPLTGQSSWVVDVVGGPNDDTLTVRLNGAVTSSLLQVRGDLGLGNDHVVLYGPATSTGGVIDFDLALGPGNNTLDLIRTAGATLGAFRSTVNVDGGDVAINSDKVSVNMANPNVIFTTGSRFALNANLLAGNDAFTLNDAGCFTGSESRFRVKGGAGNDVLQAGTVLPGLYSNDGLIETVFDGGPGADILDIEKHVEGLGTYRVRAHGGDSSDIVVTSVFAEDVGFGINTLDLLARGGRGADTLYTAIFAPVATLYNPSAAALLDGGGDVNDICIFFGNGKSERFACESGS
jgi:hypothetical protein